MRWLQARMEPLHAVLLTLLAASMMLPSLFARPHALVWPLTAMWVGTLVGCSDDNRAPPWWLLGVLLLWVNMHGSFIIGPALALVIAAESIMNARDGRWRIAKRWLPFVLGALACMFVNPQGYQLVLFPFHLIGQRSALAMVVEWQPPNFQHPQVLGVWLVAFMTLALLGRVRLSPLRSVVLVGLLYMALQHMRNVALLGLISPFLLAQPIATLWRQSPLPGRDANAIDRLFRALVSPARHATAWTMVVLATLAAAIALNGRDLGPPDSVRPRAALDVLLARVPQGRILNDPGFGDYLIYRGVPDFMDDRVDVYGDAFLTQTVAALSLSQDGDLEGMVKQYRIDAILLSTRWPAVRLLDRLSGWERVYSDKLAVAYVRRGAHQS